MVVKRDILFKETGNPFESSVISYGSKTRHYGCDVVYLFESSVISYGSKTPN